MLIGGLDEVGWGCLAGPIVSVVAVMTEQDMVLLPSMVNDSKQLTEKKRDALYEHLCACCTDKGLGCVWPYEIDTLGPKFALQESYKRAIEELRYKPDLLIVDGRDAMNRVRAWKGKQLVEPKADAKYKQVSVASIIAKVFRDRLMVEEAARRKKAGHAHYEWKSNKGYGSKDHMRELQRHGLVFDYSITSHRRSYCSELLGTVPCHACR